MSLIPIYDPSVLEPVFEVPRPGPALSGIAESAPDQFRVDDLTRGVLAARNRRPVVPEPRAQHFGVAPSARTLLRGGGAGLGTPRFDDWFKSATAQAPRRDSYPVSEVSHA